MVCDEEVGWRNVSRRVIIFTTDQSFHIAMDGKLGGLVTPNDGRCHLNQTGFYTYSTVQDYPSIGHINHIAKEKSVSIIWAVTEDKFGLYEHLSQMVAGSSAGMLTSDSSNIVELVKQQYRKITTSIEVKASNSKNCKVEIKPKCLQGGSNSEPCSSNVELGTSIHMQMKVTLKSCRSETFTVYPVGIDEEMLVEIDPLCTCDCADQIAQEEICQSPECNFAGHLVCGVCQCCGNAFGTNCQCADGTPEQQEDPDFSCRPTVTNGTSSRFGPVCFGRGECDCGTCICDTPRLGVNITGKFCQTVR